MVKSLRILALLCALAVIIFWLERGADRGWSKTSVPVIKVDPVTEIEFVEYEDRFIPGVDILALGFITSGTLFFLSFVLSKIPPKKSS
jgi:hypothetical protein